MLKYHLLLMFSLATLNVIGQKITLLDVTSGKEVKFPQFQKGSILVIVFTSNTCPYSKYYEERLVSLYNKCTDSNVDFIVINSNSPTIKVGESNNAIKERNALNGFTFPYLIDIRQEAMELLGARKNPEAFVISKNGDGFKILYQGAIDDNPKKPDGVKNAYLENAINLALKNQSAEFTHAYGCSIKY